MELGFEVFEPAFEAPGGAMHEDCPFEQDDDRDTEQGDGDGGPEPVCECSCGAECEDN